MHTSELHGVVAAVVYEDTASGFGVVVVDGDAEAADARASGLLAGLAVGQEVRLIGRWVDHPRHGPTFSVERYSVDPPRSREALVAFLASDRFPRIGKVLARRVVETFGDELRQVIETDPQRLTAVRGVSPGVAGVIASGWASAGALAELTRALGAAGLPPAAVQAVHRRFGDEALALADTDPYQLLAARGVDWRHVEALARTAGIEADDPRRLTAAATTAQRRLTREQGHTCTQEAPLLAAARKLVGDGALANRAMRAAAGAGTLVPQTLDSHTVWYLAGDLAAERGLAAELARLLHGSSRLPRGERLEVVDDDLTADQRRAVEVALRHPVSVLTGGPGTGKTRTVRALVASAEAAAANVALCAPTGRAAKRLEELCGHSATTVHRLLDARPDGGSDGGFRFGYDEDRPLPHDLVVVDEVSMADTALAWSLARAVGDGAHLVLVGDADQLPSVGPGAVLRDLVRAQECGVGVESLTTVHRQAARSRIVTLAHEVNSGAVRTPRGRDGDVFAVPERSDRIPVRVAEIVAARAPVYFDCDPSDVQVLAPIYRGPAGVDTLNAALKARLNPPAGRRAVGGFHEGDRVVQTRNDADLDVSNGDIGEVVVTDSRERRLTVALPQGNVEYPSDRVEDLAPAWCLTVHKSQGGEWPVVVLVLDRSHRRMLWRELVYTAVTRAARALLLVGDPALVAQAATRSGSAAGDRRTGLTHHLTAAVAKLRVDHARTAHTEGSRGNER